MAHIDTIKQIKEDIYDLTNDLLVEDDEAYADVIRALDEAYSSMEDALRLISLV